ncbi:hypothetical protein ABZ816_32040 [Actinosynnema sp. NPDC047251]|uniref:Putative secreted protein n=1 Tax=Saccharothrix espanaensis (strain ATCC 51144 / DSM 44229 / JCM 9112 / NBRC 15066 / NRRL 15764) TaxID=1179773 RepID=K0K0B3_SACES|nr:hypothetical protein [Saccharothrix espanaensis]CCH29988.1 putative secreted protein [Saccharothrix espanaensis DSM 44229]
MKAAAVLGTVLLVLLTPPAFLYGLFAFTPTIGCEDSNTGVCAYGQLPMMLNLLGLPVLVLVALLGTWVGRTGRSTRPPRFLVPYVGILAVLGLEYLGYAIASS